MQTNKFEKIDSTQCKKIIKLCMSLCTGVQSSFRPESAPKQQPAFVPSAPSRADPSGRLSQLEKLQYELTRQVGDIIIIVVVIISIIVVITVKLCL
jgi:hypothetical protein